MKRLLLLIVSSFVLCGLAAFDATAQVPAQADTPLTVSLECEACDRAAIQKAIAFVAFVAPPAAADVSATVLTSGSETSAQRTFTVTGQGRFAGRTRTLALPIRPAATGADATIEITRALKLLLAEFAAETPLGRRLDVSFRPPVANGTTQPLQKDLKDPWHHWVFRLNASTSRNGESQSSDRSTQFSGSANRTTEQWKVRTSAYRNSSKSTFDLDETTTIINRQSDWSLETLVVKSLGPRWSLGLTSSLVGSTYSNSRRVLRFDPGIEFDWFPYSESSRRSLTFVYTVGAARYHYEKETIFDKLEETVAVHSFRTALGLRQPWGQAGAGVLFVQQLSAPERTRLSLNANMNIRLLRSLTLSTSGSYSRIRDQFTLEKGEATEEEVLLRQRQLATGFRYSFSFGFGYSFGALTNATVNPRFGGG